MTSRLDYALLGIAPGADVCEVKAAYWKLAKHNHPDLHRSDQLDGLEAELRMMRINIAYRSIMSKLTGRKIDAPTGLDVAAAQPQGNAVSTPKDPAYTYYKRGFYYYRRAYSELYSKERRHKGNRQSPYNRFILELVLNALYLFDRAHSYFSCVVSDYPDSGWAEDARAKLRRIESFDTVYRRISRNLSHSLQSLRAAAGRP